MLLKTKKTLIPVPYAAIGTYKTAEDAARQAELVMLNRDEDTCLNIVQSEKGYTVWSVKWQ